MSMYKAGLGIGLGASQEQPLVAGEGGGPSLGTMVVAGVVSGLVLLAVSKATSHKKLAIVGPSRQLLAHQAVTARYRKEGLPWT